MKVCQRGHEMTAENTYAHEGRRRCKACMKLRRPRYSTECLYGHRFDASLASGRRRKCVECPDRNPAHSAENLARARAAKSPPTPAMGRALARFTVDDGCWIWTGARDPKGYGRLKSDRSDLAHRIVYEALREEIPDGLTLDHLCRTPECVRPAHLEVVTAAENTRRGLAGINQALKTHCPAGHPYNAENTRIEVTGGRRCVVCQRVRNRGYYLAKREAEYA